MNAEVSCAARNGRVIPEPRALTRDGCVQAERAALARNMSAPPSTTLTFSTLAPAPGEPGDKVGGGAGLSFVCRLDMRALLPPSRQDTRPGFFYGMNPEQVHHRLRLGLVYVLAEATGKTRSPVGAFARAGKAPVEQVADQLRDLLAAESLAAAGLPRFGLLLPPHGADRKAASGIRQTLAILARRRGKLFLRDADPIVWSAAESDVVDLWTPVLSTGRTA